MTRKTKKVEFHFDERSQVMRDEVEAEYPSELARYAKDVDVVREFEYNLQNMAVEINRLRAALAKTDPIVRIYDEGMPVLVCLHCGGERPRFENEVRHTDDCIWVRAKEQPGS